MKNYFLISFCFLVFIIIGCNQNKNKNTKIDELISIDTTAISLHRIDSLHTRRNMKDYDQTLIDYINSNPNKPTETKNTIYLLPVGNIKPEIDSIIHNEVGYLGLFFQLPVKVLPKVSFEEILKNSNIKTRLVPDDDFIYFSKMKGEIPHTENLREQIQASSFMNEYMLKNKPKDAVAVLAITEHDIYNPNYNYLFGTSSLKDGIGMVSTYRLVDYGDQTINTIRKVTSKQLTNLFSIKNVKDYECLLNFHNNINSQIQGEFRLSPRVLEKLKYSIRFDYNKRFKELEDFWRKNENEKLAEYYKMVQK